MKFYSLLFFLLLTSFAHAQKGRDEALAKSYFENGEYEKASDLYQQLWEKSGQQDEFYQPLLKSFYALNKYDDAEKIIRKQIKHLPSNPLYQIDLGDALSKQNASTGSATIPESAKKIFEKVVKDLHANDAEIRQVANTFHDLQLMNYEIATYEKANKLFSGRIDYSPELASANMSLGNYTLAAKYYLEFAEKFPEQTQRVKNTIQTSANGDKLMSELETALYTKIQKQPDNEDLIDFLTWIYIQNKDFESALLQMRALDKRTNGDGAQVLEVAQIAQLEGFYDEALSGYEYIAKKQPRSYLYFEARSDQLNCRKEKIAKTINYTQADLLALKADYEQFISENEGSPQVAQSIKELADLQGFYLHDLNAAIDASEKLIAMQGISQKLKNQAKLSLGDFYLMSGDVWESTLFYSQVDKSEKDSPLGEEARFKNAKLSYYKGEFDWAQTQLNILKSATSQLISNDAINLSVFIIDNLGLDTVPEPMQLFANADLLSFQNKDDEAEKMLDSIVFKFPGHELYDDILFAKAQIFVRKRAFTKAIPLLEEIVQHYGQDLKGDDALFLLADITENELHDKEKAKELYQKLLTEHPSSVLVIEARKRFRNLRGDKIGD
ncbi:MAG TPA: tetratricopeptide repeat protein [Chitinophagales bacterium]